MVSTISSRRLPGLSLSVFGLAALFLAIRLGIAVWDYVDLSRAALTFPYPLDYGEGPILDQTLRLSRLENIYRNSFSQPPYTVSNYPPLFHLLQVPFALLFGPAFWYGRLISILSALAACILLGLILYTLTKDWFAALVAGLLLLIFPFLMQWSVYNRVDALGLALSLGGLYACARNPEDRKSILLAALLFTAAVYTKPSYALAGPLTAFAWCLLTRQFKPAFRLASITLGLSLVLFLILNLLTRGGFYLNTIRANVNPYSIYTVTGNLISFYLHTPYLLFGSAIFLIIERLGKPTRSWSLVLPYLISAGASTLFIGKDGSSTNYLLEAAAALCLAAGAFLAWSGEKTWLRAGLVFVLAFQVAWLVEWSRQDYLPLVKDKVAEIRDIEQLAQLVRQADSPVLADEFMGLVPLEGKPLYFQPFEFKMLQQAGLWQEDAFVNAIQARQFSVILLWEPRTWNAVVSRWTRPQREAIYANYRQVDRLAEAFVYVPKEGNP